MHIYIYLRPGRCKTSSAGQSAGLLIPSSSVTVRLRQKLKKSRTQIYMDSSYIDPQARVLNYCYKQQKQLSINHTYAYAYICTRTHLCLHDTVHTLKHWYYICKHASTPGTTARQQMREELIQMQRALHVSFVRRNQTTFSTSNARTSLYPLPETPIPLNPPSPLPNIPQNSSRSENSGAAETQ